MLKSTLFLRTSEQELLITSDRRINTSTYLKTSGRFLLTFFFLGMTFVSCCMSFYDIRPMKSRLPFLFAALALIAATHLSAQEETKEAKNIIVNGSFEEANTAKLKKLGQLSLVKGWTTANDEKVDLFSKKASYPEVGAPKNVMGISNPKDGSNYIGIVTHLVASRDSREYITSALDGFLAKGKKYCLSYSISMADGAKFATNNLGFHFSKKPVYEDKDAIIKDEVILPLDNRPQDNMDNWENICHTFTAKGYEKFVTIGNFSSSSKTVAEKKTKPSGFKGEQQQMGYYFLDDISLVEIARESDCSCDDEDEDEGPRIIFSKSATFNERASIEDKVKASTVYFYSNEDGLAGPTKRDLDKLAELMQSNASLRIAINGHMDEKEVDKGNEFDTFKDLSQTRADEVKQYLVDKGVSSSRMLVKSFKGDEPATKMKTPLSLAKNRRVVFSVR